MEPAATPVLTSFRAFLVGWTAVVLLLWISVGIHVHFAVPKHPAAGFSLWKVWNGYYSGVWGAGIFFAPALTFHVWAARRYGVNAAYAFLLLVRLLAISACATLAFLAWAAIAGYRPHLAGLDRGDAWWLLLLTLGTAAASSATFVRPDAARTGGIVTCCIGAIAAVAAAVAGGSVVSAWSALALAAAALAWLGVAGRGSEVRGSLVGGAIVVLSIGGALWGIGNLIWFWVNTCTFWPSGLDCARSVEVPYPSWADAGYLAILPTAAVALLLLTRVLGLGRGDVLRFWPLPVVVLAITGYFTLSSQSVVHDVLGFPYGRSYLFDPEYTWFATFVSYVYVASDAVLLSLSIVLLLAARQRAGGTFLTPLAWISLSMILLFVGDFFFFQRVANESFYNGDFSDMLYGLFTISMSIGVFAFARAEARTAAQLDADAAGDAGSDGATSADDDALDARSPHEQLAGAIVAGQRGVIGVEPADDAARRVPGVVLARDGAVSLAAGAGDAASAAAAVERLVATYSAISGPLGERLCWAAARPVLARHPDLHVAAFDRFAR